MISNEHIKRPITSLYAVWLTCSALDHLEDIIYRIEHLLYYCLQSKRFITEIEDWINRTYGKHYNISIIDFLIWSITLKLGQIPIYFELDDTICKMYKYTHNLTNENVLLRFHLDLKFHTPLEQYAESVIYPDGENSQWEELLSEL